MNQFQFAPVPRFPLITPRVVDDPLQIGEVPVAEVADPDNVFTIIVAVAQVVELQVPDANT